MNQKPSLGRIVLVPVDKALNNGGDVAPAVVTRVWSDELVNLRVLLDGTSDVLWKTSVPLYADREALDAKHAELPEGNRPNVPYGAYWPPRV